MSVNVHTNRKRFPSESRNAAARLRCQRYAPSRPRRNLASIVNPCPERIPSQMLFDAVSRSTLRIEKQRQRAFATGYAQGRGLQWKRGFAAGGTGHIAGISIEPRRYVIRREISFGLCVHSPTLRIRNSPKRIYGRLWKQTG